MNPSDEKTDHEALRKRGRPKKETPTSKTFKCRYKGSVRTYAVEFVVGNFDGTVEVQSVTVTSQGNGTNLKSAIDQLGVAKIKNLIHKELVREKVITPLEHLFFLESSLLK